MATLTVRGVGQMSHNELNRLADWIRGQGNWVLIKSKELSKRYTARLWK